MVSRNSDTVGGPGPGGPPFPRGGIRIVDAVDVAGQFITLVFLVNNKLVVFNVNGTGDAWPRSRPHSSTVKCMSYTTTMRAERGGDYSLA